MEHIRTVSVARLAAVFLLPLISLGFGCSKQGPTPAAPAPATVTTQPAAVTTLPTTLPAGTYRVAAETIFGRGENGRLDYEPIEAGELVDLLRADPEWSRVRRRNGQLGLVPTARLEPKISFEVPDNAATHPAPAPVDTFVAGQAMPPAVPLLAPGAEAAPVGEAFQDQVHRAIGRAAQYLESQRRHDNWEENAGALSDAESEGRWGRLTALATLALVSGGQGNASPSITWLQNADPRSISAVALRAQIPQARGGNTDSRSKVLIDADALLLASALASPGQTPLVVTIYTGDARSRDIQMRHEVMAGLISLIQAGAEIPLQIWEATEQASRGTPDGDWVGPGASAANRAGANAAAIASRVSIDEQLGIWDRGMYCQAGVADESILRGMAWLDAHASDAIGDPAAMWSLEQAARATGRKYVGGDWYRAGAGYLLRTQRSDGSWPPSPGTDPAGGSISATAFALLFLSHGSAPLIINKLDYESVPDLTTRTRHFGPAQRRPGDVAHFGQWVGRELEWTRPPNWQWVNFSMPTADFQEAPILYITGSEAFDFTPPQIDLLRTYVQRGGLIVGNAECASSAFSRSFLKLGQALFPSYEFRMLLPDHPLLNGEAFKATNWRHPSTIQAISNGVRELMLLIPTDDLSRAWQADSTVSRRDRFELGMDIVAYASHPSGWPDRGHWPTLTTIASLDPKRTIRVARLTAGDNPDPEPAGWERLAILMHNQFATQLDVRKIAPAANSLTGALPPFMVASLTGTTALNLSDAERKEIAAFVNAGGTLIVDAAGGNAKFAASVEAELAKIFPPPGQPLGVVLSPDDDLYRLKVAGIDHFAYRRFARGRLPGHLNAPRLRGIAVGNRIAVFFSAEDLSNGLVGQETDGIIGYGPETATAIMRNLLLYAVGER